MSTAPRLDLLESSNRRLRLGISLLALCLLVLFTVAMVAPVGQYYANRFGLKDVNDRDRAYFEMSREQTPGLWFIEPGGKGRLFVGMSIEERPLIQFFNADGEPCYYLNETGRHEGSGMKDENDDAAGGAPGKVRWPTSEKELKKTVYVNDNGEDRFFHRWGCGKMDRKTKRGLTVQQAKDRGKLPCTACCGEMCGE